MYQIIGRVNNEPVSIHYSNDLEYLDIVKKIEWFKPTDGKCVNLEINAVSEEREKKNTYVGWIKEIVKYYKATGYIAHDCRDIPEFY